MKVEQFFSPTREECMQFISTYMKSAGADAYATISLVEEKLLETITNVEES